MTNPGKKLLTVNFTPEQLARIKSRAHALEMSMSRYIRYCVAQEMDSPPRPQTLADTSWYKFQGKEEQ